MISNLPAESVFIWTEWPELRRWQQLVSPQTTASTDVNNDHPSIYAPAFLAAHFPSPQQSLTSTIIETIMHKPVQCLSVIYSNLSII